MDDNGFEAYTGNLAERRQRRWVVLIAVPALAGVLLALWTIGIDDSYFLFRYGIPKEILLTVVVALLGTSAMALIMTYLQTGFKRSAEVQNEIALFHRESDLARTDNLSASIAEIRDEVLNIRAEQGRLPSIAATLSGEQRDGIVKELLQQLSTETNALFLEDLKLQAAAAYSRDSNNKELMIHFDESKARLSKELESLGFRGNVNLALGAVTTVIGLVLLGLSVFSQLTEIKEMWSFVSHFVPRLSLVILIELFAFFFLRLYKSSLSEIKYFQNELTNIEARQVALKAALNHGDSAMIGEVVGRFASTERNHILSKNETTVELEKARIERSGYVNLLKHAADLAQQKK